MELTEESERAKNYIKELLVFDTKAVLLYHIP